MNKALLIARHEVLKHLLRRSFLILTLAIPLVGLVVTLVAGALNRSAGAELPGVPADAATFKGSIGYVDRAGLIASVPHYFPPTLFRAFPDEAAARAAVAAGKVRAYYLLPADYLQRGAVTRFAPQVELSPGDVNLFGTLLRANLMRSGDPQAALRLNNVLTLRTTRLDAGGNPAQGRRADDNIDRSPLTFIVPYVFALLLYFAVIFSSGLLLQSVTEEKESRMLEMLLTSLRPWQLLAGKVLGLGALGLLQTAIWLGSSQLLLALSTGRLALFKNFDLPAYTWALALLFFLLGYLIYASLMAGVGATVTSSREGSQLTVLMVMPIIVPLWFIGAIVDNPDGPLATALSLFPLTAPITMMIRVSLTDVAWWQLLLSVLLQAGAVALLLWGAARLFRVSTLLAGKRLTPAEIMRALRAASA